VALAGRDGEGKCAILVVDRNWIARIVVSQVTSQAAAILRLGGEYIEVQKGRNGSGEIGAVHEDVGLADLDNRATFGYLRRAPLEDVVF
jgi:hypothetical protein